MANNKKDLEKPSPNRWIIAVIILLVLGLFSLFAASIVGIFVGAGGDYESGNVAVIKIRGYITIDSDAGFIGPEMASSSSIVELIEEASSDDSIEAIILDINSGGGSPVASYEIAQAVLGANKTTVAWIREVGASGAYWIATSSEYIVANPMSITGSVGVIGSYLDFSGFIEDHNVTYQRMVSGEHKDMGVPFRELTSEEEEMMQANLDLVREEFVNAVAANRELPVDVVDDLSDGQIYLGMKAFELDLVDKLGGKEDVVMYIEDKLEIEAELFELSEDETFLEMLGSVMTGHSFYLGLGLGQGVDRVTVRT